MWKSSVFVGDFENQGLNIFAGFGFEKINMNKLKSTKNRIQKVQIYSS